MRMIGVNWFYINSRILCCLRCDFDSIMRSVFKRNKAYFRLDTVALCWGKQDQHLLKRGKTKERATLTRLITKSACVGALSYQNCSAHCAVNDCCNPPPKTSHLTVKLVLISTSSRHPFGVCGTLFPATTTQCRDQTRPNHFSLRPTAPSKKYRTGK